MVLFVCRVGIGPGKHSPITKMLKLGTKLYAPVQFLPLGAIEEHPGSKRAQNDPKILKNGVLWQKCVTK